MLSRTSNCSLEQWSGGRLVGVEGSSVPVHGMTTMGIQLQGQMVSIDFVVVEMLKVESLMGLDFLEKITMLLIYLRRSCSSKESRYHYQSRQLI